jgi:integrase
MPRSRRRKPVAGVRWRSGVAYFEKEHKRLAGGRIYRTLGTSDETLAAEYAGALATLMQRGDWHVIEAWRDGSLHITDIARIVREGDYAKLRKLSTTGTRLGEAVERFLRRSEATLTEKSAGTYRYGMDLLLEHFGAGLPMATLTTEQAEAFLHGPKASNQDEVWSANTQASARTMYKALWQMVIDEEAEAAHIADASPTVVLNPWRPARVPKRRQTRHAFLSAEQWRTLIDHPEVVGTREAAFLGCACLAGLRQMEIVHLRPGMDVDSSVIRVQDRKGEEAWSTKTENGQREVMVVAELGRLIDRHVQLGFSGERYLFRAYGEDRPISHTAAIKWTRRAFEAAGIRYGRKGDALTLHSLRHTFGTWMAQDGVPFHVIAELMGNTAEVVMWTYAHHAPHDLDKAMDSIRQRTV